MDSVVFVSATAVVVVYISVEYVCIDYFFLTDCKEDMCSIVCR